MQDMAMMGLSRGWISGSNLLVPVTCKVSINMQVKGMIVNRLHDEAFVQGAFEVPANLFDSFSMLPLRIMGKTGALMNSIGQVRSGELFPRRQVCQ